MSLNYTKSQFVVEVFFDRIFQFTLKYRVTLIYQSHVVLNYGKLEILLNCTLFNKALAYKKKTISSSDFASDDK